MGGKITLTVTRGELEGKVYEYTEPDRIFVGRKEDCGIVLPENTVSRYHCLLDINPPKILLKDFGSLNGTYLNDEKIGQREREQSPEEAEGEDHETYELHDGDRVRLGKRCEITCAVVVQEEPEEASASVEPKEEDEESEYLSVSQGEQKVCAACGNMFPPTSPDDTLCMECRQDREKMLGVILAALIGGAIREEAPAGGPSPVKGFERVERLGKGGMGEVWKVREESTGKLYALKTMLPEAAANPKVTAMFLREAKLSEYLDHKNVVRTYQTGCADGTFFILMELCEGGSVDDLMKRQGGRLTLNMATLIMLQVLDGLDYVHHVDVDVEIRKRGIFGRKTMNARGLVHRDFKTGNIFLSDRGDHPVAKVADFGMAKAFQAAGFSSISNDNAVRGTVPFMPRQQALDCRYAKPEVDVWAAAASYYHMLTGEFPKNFRSGKNMWQAIVTEKAVPILERGVMLPSGLAEVIDRALQEEPEIGCKSAAELREAIVDRIPAFTREYCRDFI